MYNFITVWACQGISDHAHPEYDHQFATFMDLYLHTKNQSKGSIHCQDVENLLFQHALGMPGHT